MFDEYEIKRTEKNIYEGIKNNFDALAKPIDSLGEFEELIAGIGAIQGKLIPKIDRKALIIMCADNGIVREGVTQTDSSVTLSVARSMAEGKSPVCRMANIIGVDTIPVDIGMDCDEVIHGIKTKKIKKGTKDFYVSPAMTGEEALAAIRTGIELVKSSSVKYDILALGEMGIGNTTTSSAVCAALFNMDAAEVTGRGAGLSDEGLKRKISVINESVKKYDLYGASPLEVLSKVGGLDIAGLVGLCIGGAIYRIPVILDGFISLTAAAIAVRMRPEVRDYLIPSHRGKEKGCELLLKDLSFKPVIDAGLALGEGTGAVMLIPLLETALSVYRDGTSFEDINVKKYERFV